MFSKVITNKGAFLMMPPSTQLLYFHLGMNADDDGFVEAYTVMNMCRANEGDIDWLQEKSLVQLFDGAVAFMVHWRENNDIRWDRYTPSIYQYLKPGYCFREPIKLGSTSGSTQDRLGKVSKRKIKEKAVVTHTPGNGYKAPDYINGTL